MEFIFSKKASERIEAFSMSLSVTNIILAITKIVNFLRIPKKNGNELDKIAQRLRELIQRGSLVKIS